MRHREPRRVPGRRGLLGIPRTLCPASGGSIWHDPRSGLFDHKVMTAYRWPVDEFSERLARAGFAEVERLRRPGDGTYRPHAAIAAVATEG
jgi:hypothetical protein